MSQNIGRWSLFITSLACTAELPRGAVDAWPSGRDSNDTRLL